MKINGMEISEAVALNDARAGWSERRDGFSDLKKALRAWEVKHGLADRPWGGNIKFGKKRRNQ